MILIDTALRRRADEGRPVRFALFGAGFMGRGIVNQAVRHTPGMHLSVVCNRSVEAAVEAYRRAGIDDVTVVASSGELDDVIRRGGHAVTDDPAVVCGSGSIEVVVEATGHIEYGARVTLAAIDGGKHVVLMNAELDATVGPLLKRKADAAGVIITGCDGDQPAVQMNLIRTVRSFGLRPLLAGNIKGLEDHYRNPTTQASFAAQWGQTPSMVTSFADGTKMAVEQTLVANATGMGLAQRGMLGLDYSGHVDDMVDMYDIDMLRERGGIVDYVVGAKPSPGVYVFAEALDGNQPLYLDYGKLGKGPLYSFYIPYHLTVFEVFASVARAALFGDAAIAPLAGPVCDVLTVAKVDSRAGEVLDGLGEYKTFGQIETHAVVRAERLLPMGLAEGCRLVRDVKKDQVLTYDDVELPQGSLVHELRAQQDALFAPAAEAGR